MTPRTSFHAKVLTAFSAATLVVAALCLADWKLAYDARDAVRWVEHTQEIRSALAEIRAESLAIELSTQNFRITGNPLHLAERNDAIAKRKEALEQIHRGTADNPLQQERWRALNEVVEQRLAISRQIEILRQRDDTEAANAYAAQAPLKETRERMYQLIAAMADEENRLLAQRDATRLRTGTFLTTIGALTAIALFILLAGSYMLIRLQLQLAESQRQALAESEQSLATTLHSIGDAVLATDAQGRITRMNPVAERLTGWRLAEALGRKVEEVFRIIHERTREPAEIPVIQVLASGEVRGLASHTALIARDGRECPIADSAAPIRDGDGKIHGVVLVFRDETTERRAQFMIQEQNALLEQRVRERTEQLNESEDRLRNVINNVPALIAFVDTQQRYVYVNNQYRQNFAPEHADITGRTVRDILGERYATAAPRIELALQGHSQTYDWEPFPGIWQVINYAPQRDAQGQVVGYYVLGTDITERKQAEAVIQDLNTELARHVHQLEHVSRALRTLSAGNRAMLRATDEQALLDSMCAAIVDAGGYDTAVVWYCLDDMAKSLLPMAQSGYPGGLTALDGLGSTWADDDYGHGAVATAVRSGTSRHVGNIPADPGYAPWQEHLSRYASTLACPLRVGHQVIGALAIYDTEVDAFGPDEIQLLGESADDLAFGIATLRARVEQQQNQETVHRLSHYDTLTGLPNETHFSEALNAALDTGQRLQRPFAMFQANIERLSEINDALGFAQGDQLLCEFASRLRTAVPQPNTVARLRGDEFSALLPDAGAGEALAMVLRLEEALARPFRIADIGLEITTQIGIVLYPEHGTSTHDLYRNMDIAVHQAKKDGAPHRVFIPEPSPERSRRLTIASELRRAIEGGDLRLYLHPKVDMATGRVSGAEGLVRWQHAQRGLIPPGEFIGLAENTGLIRPLTEWVIETAMLLLRDWQGQGCALPIAVNLSARNLRDDNLLERIRRLQADLGVAPGLFEMELTESTVMEDAEFALRVLHGLRDTGIPLYIDDFGTGYSSLAYLQKLPVDYIKIDQSFVRGMDSKDCACIVRSTIDMVHDLGRKAVAEGIETRESWDQLARLGCDYAQGYFIARPMPAEEFPAWVEAFRPPADSPQEHAPAGRQTTLH